MHVFRYLASFSDDDDILDWDKPNFDVTYDLGMVFLIKNTKSELKFGNDNHILKF